MNRPPKNNAYVSQLLVFALTLALGAASAGFAVVRQQMRITQTANSIKALEEKIADIARYRSDITSQIATEQSFEALTRRNASFNLGLAPIREQQIVRVTEQPELRLARKRNAETLALMPDTAPANSATTALAPVRFVSLTR